MNQARHFEADSIFIIPRAEKDQKGPQNPKYKTRSIFSFLSGVLVFRFVLPLICHNYFPNSHQTSITQGSPRHLGASRLMSLRCSFLRLSWPNCIRIFKVFFKVFQTVLVALSSQFPNRAQEKKSVHVSGRRWSNLGLGGPTVTVTSLFSPLGRRGHCTHGHIFLFETPFGLVGCTHGLVIVGSSWQ